jgi:hypothetical protein
LDALRPPYPIGDHPLFLELSFDSDIASDRDSDIWHRDHWKRSRDAVLTAQSQSTSDWIQAYRQSVTMSRKSAVVKELPNLLTTLTGFTFFTYDNAQYWFKPSRTGEIGAP